MHLSFSMVVAWTLFGLVNWRLASSLICVVRPTLRARVQVRELLNTRVPNNIHTKYTLKGQCHKIFCSWFLSWISFPQAPEYTIWAVSNFFENLRRYSQLNVDHRYQRHRQQILSPVSLVLLIPMTNLPPVSTILAANLLPMSTTSVANCHRYQRHRNLPPVSTTSVANNGINIRLQIP